MALSDLWGGALMITLCIQAAMKFLRLPAWAHVALAAFIGLSLMQITHARVVHRFEAEKAALVQTIATRDATIANLYVSVTQERLNVSTLTARLREQNAAILLMQATAKAAAASSALAVNKALAAGQANAAARLSSTVAPGYESLNAAGQEIWAKP